jgi:hypothetical protein
MVAKTMTLSDYVGDTKSGDQRVLVEHGRCGGPLGEHIVVVAGTDLTIRKHGDRRDRDGVGWVSATRGPETTPGLRSLEREHPDGKPYVRCYCVCLPDGHADKCRLTKLGQLPVTFPEWKWGRPVDLPVVTF